METMKLDDNPRNLSSGLKKCSQRVLPAVVGSQTRCEKTTLSKNENYVDENEDRHDKSDHCGASERVEKEYISKINGSAPLS